MPANRSQLGTSPVAAERVLTPLGLGGDRRYQPSIIDLASDTPVSDNVVQASVDAIVIVEGSFLQRPELAELWDRIFIDTSLPVARTRGTRRDAEQLGGLARAEQAYDARYHAAARIYLATVHPAERATLIVNNDDLADPQLQIPV